MAGLGIFARGTEGSPSASTRDDVVGRFRSGYTNRNRPVALTEWRVTADEESIAAEIAERFGGEVTEWEATGDDVFQVFTSAKTVAILIDSRDALVQKMTLWGRNGKPIRSGDGVTLDDGTPDPEAGLSIAERKENARNGIGAAPDIRLRFRLADLPDLGTFEFKSGSWSFASDLGYFGIEDEIRDRIADADGEPIEATLTLEPVSFVAKNGPQAGKTVSYTKPVLRLS